MGKTFKNMKLLLVVLLAVFISCFAGFQSSPIDDLELDLLLREITENYFNDLNR